MNPLESLYTPTKIEDGSVYIVGTGKTAEIYLDLLTSSQSIAGFIVDPEYKTDEMFHGYPVYTWDTLPNLNCYFIVAVTYQKMSQVRRKLFEKAQATGLRPLSSVHSCAEIGAEEIGLHNFIFEFNNLQYGVKIKDNNILWSSNHIGHHTTIGSHNFFSSHVTIAGNCTIGDHNFFGIGSQVADGVTIGNYCWLSPGAIALTDLPDYTLLKGPTCEISKVNTKRMFKLNDITD